MLPQHTHSHTRSSAQCLGNTRKATLKGIDTQKEDWVSKVARYTFEACFTDVQLVWGSKEFLGSHGDDVIERMIAEACFEDKNHLKTNNQTTTEIAEMKRGEKLLKQGRSTASGRYYRLG